MENVLCREVVPFSEGPLTEVSLYYAYKYLQTAMKMVHVYLMPVSICDIIIIMLHVLLCTSEIFSTYELY